MLQITCDPARRCIPLSSFNGHGTARSLAKLYGILANGGKEKDKVLLSTKMIDLLFSPVVTGISLDMGHNNTLGRGVITYYNVKVSV